MKMTLLQQFIRSQLLEMKDQEQPDFIWAENEDGSPMTDKKDNPVGYWENNPGVYWTWDGRDLKMADMD